MAAGGQTRGTGATTAQEFAHELLADIDVQINGSRPWDIIVHDDRLWDRVIRERELGLGESYMDGWWDCEQLDELMLRVISADLRKRLRPSRELIALTAKARLTNRQSPKRAAANAQAHYDIGNDLYQRMLDKRMIYTCGYWANASSLDEAQEAKLDLICRKLEFEPGMRVLDIGCGWGGFVQFAAERYGVSAVGITPAVEQVKIASERTEGLDVEIVAGDYRELQGQFDRIVSIGMFEHVGARNYETFFEACDSLLTRDGMMLHHTIGGTVSNRRGDPWFDKYIFPGGMVPSLTQISQATEGTWYIEDVHNFGPDYDRTLMAWAENIERLWHEIPDYDERFRRMWHYYLLTSAAGFRARSTHLWQIVFRRTYVATPTWKPVR